MMLTSPTPLMDSICCLILLSAMSVTSRCERGAETAMRTTGAASVSNFCTMGCSAVTGRSLTMRSTLLRTSCAAMSGFFSSRKVMKTCDTPSTEVERSSSIALIVLTAPSTLSVISVSISCGDAPGLTTVTVIVGRSIFGKRSTPSDRYEKSPTTVRLRMIIVANTGRRTQISASFCIVQIEVQSPRSKVQGPQQIAQGPKAAADCPGTKAQSATVPDFGLWTLDYHCLTAVPSPNCSRLLVATISFAAMPFLISTKSPSVCPN